MEGSVEQVVRRSVSPSRSKAYLDGGISTASTLAEDIGPKISIVGQHDQHTITSAAGIRSLVDRMLDGDGLAARDTFDETWAAYVAVNEEAASLGGDHRALERERDMLRFQVSEIEDAAFESGEEEELRTRAVRLRSAETLAVHIDTAMTSLGEDGASQHLSSALGATRIASGLDASLTDMDERIDELLIILGELRSDLGRYASLLTSDPKELGATEDRLADLAA